MKDISFRFINNPKKRKLFLFFSGIQRQKRPISKNMEYSFGKQSADADIYRNNLYKMESVDKRFPFAWFP